MNRGKIVTKILAILLTAAMLTGQYPAHVFAEEVQDGWTDENAYVTGTDETEQTLEEETYTEGLSEGPTDDTTDATEDIAEGQQDETEESSAVDGEEVSAGEEETAEEDQIATEELPYGIKGMPEDYVLTEDEREVKENVVSHDVVGDTEKLTEGVDYVEDEVICLADSLEQAELIAEAYGGELTEFSYGVATISLANTDLTVAEAVAIGADPDINIPAVEANHIIRIDPIEPSYSVAHSGSYNISQLPSMTTWDDITDPSGAYDFDDPALDPRSINYQWMHEMVNTYGAWGVTTGSTAVTVAVIDTGVLTSHEEFAGRASAVNVGQGTGDPVGHGTHVAGIIAAAAGNGKGGAGIAPGVKIMGLRTATDTGGLNDRAIIKAIQYVAGVDDSGNVIQARQADIINMSLGGPKYDAELQMAINHAYKAGVTVCAAMGNNLANDIGYPGACDHVISVGSVDETGIRSYFSTYGAWGDIAAPGSNIYSTYNAGNSSYDTLSGTSMACPVVAGVCALYMSAVGHVDPDTMERVLKASVSKTTSKGIGVGIVDAAKMFAGDVTAPVITLTAGSGATAVNLGVAKDASTLTVGGVVPVNTKITIDRDVFNGNGTYQGNTDTGNRNREILVYTTDGKLPTIKDGELVYGKEYNGAINIADIVGTATGKTKVTVKAACVTGMGVLGKITTMTFNVDPTYTMEGVVSAQTVTIEGLPEPPQAMEIVAGKPMTLKAKVGPEGASQKVSWRIKSYTDGDLSKAKIVSTSGALSTDAYQHGTLTVECISADGNASKEAIFKVVSGKIPVGSLKLDKAKVTLNYSTKANDNNILAGKNRAIINISELRDNTKRDISYLAGTGVTLQWTSSNENVVTVAPSGNLKATVTAKGKGTAVITCTALDGSGIKTTCNISVVQDVEEITVTGQKYIAKKGSASFKANVLPATADNKNVDWEIRNSGNVRVTDPKIAKITASGSVTVGENASGTYTVIATAKDESGVTGRETFTVKEDKTSYMKVTSTANEADYMIVKDKTTGSITGLRLFTKQTSANKTYTTITFNAKAYDKNNNDITGTDLISWTIANPKDPAASLTSSNGGRTATLSVLGNGNKGSVTVNATALDGSGKKATIKVTVAEPVDSITVTGQKYIAKKGSAAFKANVIPATADNKNVDWEIRNSGNVLVTDPKIAKITASGSVTVGENASGTYTVIATAKDGSGVTGRETFTVKEEKTSYVKVTSTASETDYMIVKDKTTGSITGLRLFTKKTSANKTYTTITFNAYAFDKNNVALTDPDILSWTIANPKDPAASLTSSNGGRTATLSVLGNGNKGTVTVNATALDGSGKKATIKVTVAEPVDSITVTGQKYIAKKSSANYKANVLPATADNKNVDWEIRNSGNVLVTDPKIAKITASGGVTVGENASGTYTVIATAKDGSGVTGRETFTVTGDKTSYVKVTSAANENDYTIVKDKTTGSITGLRLFTKKTSANKTYTTITFNAKSYDKANNDITDVDMLSWTIANPKDPAASLTTSNGGRTATLSVLGNGNKGTVTVNATALDGSGKKATIKVTVAEPADSITVTGQRYIIKGGSANYKANVLPATADKKAVDWEIRNSGNVLVTDPKIAKITASGSVTVGENASGTYKVIAKAKDGSGVTGETTFTVKTTKAKTVLIDTANTDSCYRNERDNTGILKSAQLFTVNIGRGGVDERVMTLSGKVDGATPANNMLNWTTSDARVVTLVTPDNGKTVVATAHSAGSATITAEAADGSGKKASIKINVLVPVSSISLEPANGMSDYIGYGKSCPTVVAYGSAYGTPSEKKVTWELKKIRVYKLEDRLYDYDYSDETSRKLIDRKVIMLGKDGRITGATTDVINKCIADGLVPRGNKNTVYMYEAEIEATATDGSGSKGTFKYMMGPATTAVQVYGFSSYGRWGIITREDINCGSVYAVNQINCIYSDGYSRGPIVAPTVTSSNPKIATGYWGFDEYGNRALVISGHSKGSTSLAITANDGSGKKCNFLVCIH